MRRLEVLAAVAAAILVGALSGSGQARADDAPAPPPALAPKAIVLHNEKDPVTGHDAAADTSLVWEGLEIWFACPANIAKFEADPAGYAAELLRDLIILGNDY